MAIDESVEQSVDQTVNQGVDENRTTKVRVSVKKTPTVRFGRSKSRARAQVRAQDDREMKGQQPAAEPVAESTPTPQAQPKAQKLQKPQNPPKPRTSLDPHTLKTLGIGCAVASALFTVFRVFIPGSGTGTAAVVAIGLVTGAQALACAVRLTSLRTEEGALLPPVRLSLALFPVYATLFLTLNAFNGLLPSGPLRATFAIVNMVLGGLAILTVIAAVTMRLARRD